MSEGFRPGRRVRSLRIVEDAEPIIPEVTIGGSREYAMSLIGGTVRADDVGATRVSGTWRVVDVQQVDERDEASGWSLILEVMPEPREDAPGRDTGQTTSR